MYQRVKDLSGELWTVPAGSLLHAELAACAAAGGPEPYIPVELLRDPEPILLSDQPLEPSELRAKLARYMQLPADQQAQLAHRLWREGQYLRLLAAVAPPIETISQQ